MGDTDDGNFRALERKLAEVDKEKKAAGGDPEANIQKSGSAPAEEKDRQILTSHGTPGKLLLKRLHGNAACLST